MRFDEEEPLEETIAQSTDEPKVTGGLAEVRTGRGSSGLVRGEEERVWTNESRRKGKGVRQKTPTEEDEEDERTVVAPNMGAGGSHLQATTGPKEAEEEQRRAQVAREEEEQRRAQVARKEEEQRRAREAREEEEQRRAQVAREEEEQRRAQEAREEEEQRRAREAREEEEQRRACETREEEKKVEEARERKKRRR